MSFLSTLQDRLKHYSRAVYHHCRCRTQAAALRIGSWLVAHGRPEDPPSASPEKDWKSNILADFQAWLQDLPVTPQPGTNTTPESCDLFTLLSEFAALRQEIKMQNREQHKVTQNIDQLLQSYRESMCFFQDHQRDMAHLADSMERRMAIEMVRPFLAIRDAMVRGHQAAQALQQARTFFRRPPSGLDGVIEGYAMAIRRFDRILDHLQIRPTPTIGRPFDPRTMRAVATTSIAETTPGIVTEEHLSGFTRGEEIVRTAEVLVNRP